MCTYIIFTYVILLNTLVDMLYSMGNDDDDDDDSGSGGGSDEVEEDRFYVHIYVRTYK